MEIEVTNKKFGIKARIRTSTGFEKQEIRDFRNEKSLLTLLDSMIIPHFKWNAITSKERSFYNVILLDLSEAFFCDSPIWNKEAKNAIMKIYVCSRERADLNLYRVKESLRDFGIVSKEEYSKNFENSCF